MLFLVNCPRQLLCGKLRNNFVVAGAVRQIEQAKLNRIIRGFGIVAGGEHVVGKTANKVPAGVFFRVAECINVRLPSLGQERDFVADFVCRVANVGLNAGCAAVCTAPHGVNASGDLSNKRGDSLSCIAAQGLFSYAVDVRVLGVAQRLEVVVKALQEGHFQQRFENLLRCGYDAVKRGPITCSQLRVFSASEHRDSGSVCPVNGVAVQLAVVVHQL